jgi:hypothetical protein
MLQIILVMSAVEGFETYTAAARMREPTYRLTA